MRDMVPCRVAHFIFSDTQLGEKLRTLTSATPVTLGDSRDDRVVVLVVDVLVLATLLRVHSSLRPSTILGQMGNQFL